jgi:hypothetical protein
MAITVNKMRSINFFLPDVQMYSGGTTQAGSLMMATGINPRKAVLILTNSRLYQLLWVKTHLGDQGMKKILDVLIK